MTIEEAEQLATHAAAVLHAKTLSSGALARYLPLEIWQGGLHPATAGLETAEGIFVSIASPPRHESTHGEAVVLFLAPLPGTEVGGSPSNTMAPALAVLRVRNGEVDVVDHRGAKVSLRQLRERLQGE